MNKTERNYLFAIYNGYLATMTIGTEKKDKQINEKK